MVEPILKKSMPTDAGAEDDRQLLTPAQVAKWLGVSPRWVRDHISRRSPKIPAIDLGSLKRFRRVDVEAFVLEHRLNPSLKRNM